MLDMKWGQILKQGNNILEKHLQDKKELKDRRFYKAEQEAGFVEKQALHTAQTMSPAYKLAFQDTDFLLREEMRAIRVQLELLKAQMILDERGIESTVKSVTMEYDTRTGNIKGQTEIVMHRKDYFYGEPEIKVTMKQ